MTKNRTCCFLLLFLLLPTLSACKNNNPTPSTAASDELVSTMITPALETQSTSEAEIPIVNNYYIFPNSDKEAISLDSLLYMDYFTKRLARNEIFARKGYVFKDESLNRYFSNMPWYVPDEDVKGTMEELSGVEQENVLAIDNHLESELMMTSLELIRDGDRKYFTQHMNADLNYDGNTEAITINYIVGNTNQFVVIRDIEIIISDHQNREFKHTVTGENFQRTVMLADFDINDNLLQLYFDDEGPSADPVTNIYSFDGIQIIENINRLIGHVQSYDGLGKILSYDIYNVNSYYDLKNGFTPYPKENIIGREISYPIRLLLFDKAFTQYTAQLQSTYYLSEDPEVYLGDYKDNFVSMLEPDTKLEVLDIEFKPSGEADYLNATVPWLKVKTEDNIVGWFTIVYGD